MSAANCTDRSLEAWPTAVSVRFGLRLTAPYGLDFHVNRV